MLSQILNLEQYPISSLSFREQSKQVLDNEGALVLPGFLKPDAVEKIQKECIESEDKAYFKSQSHNVYLTPESSDYPVDHAFNRQVISSKGCITDDQIAADSPLRDLYDSQELKDFFSHVLGEDGLYPYADSLSSINLHYANKGQELGWHFDNSSFAITLMIQPPASGGQFEYISNVRDADKGEMNFEMVDSVLDDQITPKE